MANRWEKGENSDRFHFLGFQNYYDTIHGHHQIVNTKIRLIIVFVAKDGERSSIQSAKTRPGADCGSDHELLIAKLRLK